MDLPAPVANSYLQGAITQMNQVLDRFTDQTVNLAPHGDGTNSAAVLVTHTCACAVYWLDHVVLGRPTSRDRDREFLAESTVSDLKAMLADTSDRVDTLIRELDPIAGTTEHDHAKRLPAGPSVGSVVLHVLEELYQHLGHLELTADSFK